MKTAVLSLMLVSTLAACGPLPGYYPEDDVPGGAPTPPPAPPAAAAPRGVAPPGAPPSATTPATPDATRAAATPAPRHEGVVVVRTGNPDMRYLIDTQRRLCFFQTRSALAAVPCSSIPEAATALGTGDGASPGGPGGVSRRAPTAPAAPATPAAPAPQTAPSPDATPAPPAASDPRAAPTAAEREHFERAYVRIFCDRREGRDTEPAQRIEAEGLSVERYTAIESWAARDERVWRELTRNAVMGCTHR